ncbi:hypothetical protein ACIBG8_54440 [Nonomuraea sp. NPDC050556]|uniref:hypothetical protein n=1 Tax=Nonomuraea sp. NPDC050556 TaxID=3364369 RepID=UPI0037AB2C50
MTAQGALFGLDQVSELPPAKGDDIARRTAAWLEKSVPENTRKAYARGLDLFGEFCDNHDRPCIPCDADTLADFVTWMTERVTERGTPPAPASIEQAIAAVKSQHRTLGHDAPDGFKAAAVLKAYRNQWAADGGRVRQAPGITRAELMQVVTHMKPGETPMDARDVALFLLEFTMMGRRGELSGLDLHDLRLDDEGMMIYIAQSKTDQMARGDVCAIPYADEPLLCAVRAVKFWVQWLNTQGVTTGPVFRPMSSDGRKLVRHGRSKQRGPGRFTGAGINEMVKRRARAAGLKKEISSHSLRRGGASASRAAGYDLAAICRQGRWKDGSPIVFNYLEDDVDRWTGNAMKGVL